MRDSAAVTGGSSAVGADAGRDVIVELIPVIRRVVAARVRDFQLVDDLVQETLARVMAARDRIEQGTLAPYAVAVARNLVAAVWQGQDRARRTAHLLVQETADPPPDTEVLHRAENTVVGVALARLSPQERAVLLAHEVDGAGTADLAASSPIPENDANPPTVKPLRM